MPHEEVKNQLAFAPGVAGVDDARDVFATVKPPPSARAMSRITDGFSAMTRVLESPPTVAAADDAPARRDGEVFFMRLNRVTGC